ncbi:MAG: alpha/beta hydrolase [Stackebrandtia sp.]
MNFKKAIPYVGALAAFAAAAVVASSASADDEEISWKPCGGESDAECATFAVPRDWSDPDEQTVDLSLARLPASDGEAESGVLFYNPGGPGGSAAASVRDWPDNAFSKRLRESFDIVGVDPRGVGGSEQIQCELPVHDPDVAQFPRTQDEYDALVAHNRAVADSCDDLFAYVDTASVARDHDSVRDALGVETVSFFGLSYGSMLGTEYAELFPHRIRAMALDGVVDRSMSSPDLVIDAAAAVEGAFGAFVDWCDAEAECALHGQDVEETWDALVERAAEDPIDVPDGEPLTSEQLRYTVYAALNVIPEQAPTLAEAISEADAGDATTLAEIRAEALENPGVNAPYRSVLCLDVDPQLDNFDDLQQRMDAVEEIAPHMRGTSEFWDMTVGCLGWPVAPTNPQHPIDVVDAPPILLVGTAGDPATPPHWAESLSESIQDSRVLTHDGLGHTAYLRSECATENIDRYLVTLELPEEGTVCS